MNIVRNEFSLVNDTYSYSGLITDEENTLNFKNKIKEYISILKEIIESNFDKLTDKELYELLSKVYSIYLDEEDYIKMLSMYNNIKYNFIHEIPTTMTVTNMVKEGHGINFDYWEQLYQIHYIAITSDTFEFDYNKTYSKEEIKRMISDKSIVILKEKGAINDYPDFVPDDYELLPMLDIDINDYGNNISQFVLNNFNLFGELLRKRFNKKDVLIDLKQLIDSLDIEIREIFSNIKSNNPEYSAISLKCKEWFETSDEKEEYQNIQRILKVS